MPRKSKPKPPAPLELGIADKEWRMRNLYHIVNKDAQKVLFQPNFAQDEVRRHPALRKMILKCRQIGMTTGELLNHFDSTIFTENMNTVIMAHKDEVIEKVFRIVHTAYDSLDPRIQPALDRGGGSKYSLYFPEINSRISVALESVGETIHRLHISECALIKDAKRIKATLEAVPTLNGVVTMESTARGLGNYFADVYRTHDDIHARFFFPWFRFPEYRMLAPKDMALTDEEMKLIAYARKRYKIDITRDQIQWRRFKKITLKEGMDDSGERITFEQEYPEDEDSCFLASGSIVIDKFIVDELLKKAPEPLSRENGLRVYVEPQRAGRYVIGADTAEGIGKDLSVGVMIDTRTLEVVAVLSGYFKPHEFAKRLVAMAEKYSFPGREQPMMAVERNNHGHAVLLALNDILLYSNIYMHTDDKLGWHTNLVTRPIMMNTFTNTVENKSVTINDRQILSECLTLIDNKGKIEAEEGYRDDHVIACAIALQMLTKYGTNSAYEDMASKIRV